MRGSYPWSEALGNALQGNKQVTRAAIEWYGPDRAGVSSRFSVCLPTAIGIMQSDSSPAARSLLAFLAQIYL